MAKDADDSNASLARRGSSALPRGLFASILARQQPGSCFQLYGEGMLNVTGLLKPVSWKALDLAVLNGFPTTCKGFCEAKLIKQG